MISRTRHAGENGPALRCTAGAPTSNSLPFRKLAVIALVGIMIGRRRLMPGCEV
jgi:hypothetical protein